MVSHPNILQYVVEEDQFPYAKWAAQSQGAQLLNQFVGRSTNGILI